MTYREQCKRALAAYPLYQRREISYDLFAAYRKPSDAKIAVWKNCQALMLYTNGFGLRVISKNAQMLTCGFCYRDKKTGLLNFVYITPKYTATVEAINESICDHNNT